MVEVNRRRYMDEESGDRLPGFDALAAIIQEGVAALADAAERL